MLITKGFSLETMTKMDHGMIATLIDKAITQVVTDCYERPTERKGRQVNVTITMKPVGDDGDAVNFDVGVKTSLPARYTKSYGAELGRAGSQRVALVNMEDAENPGQETMGFEHGEEGGDA